MAKDCLVKVKKLIVGSNWLSKIRVSAAIQTSEKNFGTNPVLQTTNVSIATVITPIECPIAVLSMQLLSNTSL